MKIWKAQFYIDEVYSDKSTRVTQIILANDYSEAEEIIYDWDDKNKFIEVDYDSLVIEELNNYNPGVIFSKYKHC